MSSENDVADRLLSEARKKTAKQDSPKMGKVALIVGIIAVIVSPISILGWIFGAAAVGTGVVAVRRPISAKRGKIAIVLGVVAILVGVFFFTLSLAMYAEPTARRRGITAIGGPPSRVQPSARRAAPARPARPSPRAARCCARDGCPP